MADEALVEVYIYCRGVTVPLRATREHAAEWARAWAEGEWADKIVRFDKEGLPGTYVRGNEVIALHITRVAPPPEISPTQRKMLELMERAVKDAEKGDEWREG